MSTLTDDQIAEKLVGVLLDAYAMSDPYTVDDYARTVLHAEAANPQMRHGQAMMNVLYLVRPDIADLVASNPGTENVSQDDAQTPALLDFIESRW
ncbi:MAG: hypothetical protein EKK42_20140 [Pseudonocardiaceae bacterium]|nr:MAG: hypothetical protein EKK42_20140 [Pseudonocardiaceae bacterium]